MDLVQRMSLRVAVAGAILCSGVALAGTSATPIYHGQLGFTPARGSIDRNFKRGYLATLKVRQWALIPEAATNGISPDTEPIVIAVGAGTWRLEPGMLVASKRAGEWTYKASGPPSSRAIKSLRVRKQNDGSFSLRFVLTGIDASALNTGSPVCTPFAFIIGDDDAFTGIDFSSPRFNSKLRVPNLCVADTWLWA